MTTSPTTNDLDAGCASWCTTKVEHRPADCIARGPRIEMSTQATYTEQDDDAPRPERLLVDLMNADDGVTPVMALTTVGAEGDLTAYLTRREAGRLAVELVGFVTAREASA